MGRPWVAYVMTLCFGAAAGEGAGLYSADNLGGFILCALRVAGMAYGVWVFHRDYTAWLLSADEPSVPLGAIHPRKARARFEFRHAGIPDAYVGDSGSIPVGAR